MAGVIVLASVALLSFAAVIPLTLLSHQVGNGVVAAVIGVPCAAVGVVVARRQRENPLGWLFLAIGVCLFLSTDGGDYAVLAYHLGHHYLPLAAVGLVLAQIWGPSLVLFGVAILLFPDGRLPSRFWRWTLGVYGVSFAALLAATAVATAGALAADPIRVDATGGLTAVDHPVGWFNAVQGPLIVGVVGLSFGFIARQALSWRRAVTGLLVGVYAGLVLLATQVFRFHTPVAVAASTLAAAALFSPLRRRVQHAVDRRFNRARYDAEHTVAEFAARLQDSVDPDAVRADLTGLVQAVLEPTHVSVWLSQ